MFAQRSKHIDPSTIWNSHSVSYGMWWCKKQSHTINILMTARKITNFGNIELVCWWPKTARWKFCEIKLREVNKSSSCLKTFEGQLTTCSSSSNMDLHYLTIAGALAKLQMPRSNSKVMHSGSFDVSAKMLNVLRSAVNLLSKFSTILKHHASYGGAGWIREKFRWCRRSNIVEGMGQRFVKTLSKG